MLPAHEYSSKIKNSSSLDPLEERGDRKAEGAPRFAGGGEGVKTVPPNANLT